MECFRSALTISHNNPDVLLNLARMLLNLNYMKDAIYLAERSLDHEHPEQSTWLQHFTLAEILEKTGEYERALNHLQLALDQNPSFHPAHLIFQRLGKSPIPMGSNIYTFLIITMLCSGILLYIYMTVIREQPEDNNNNNHHVTNNNNSNGRSNKRSNIFKRAKSLSWLFFDWQLSINHLIDRSVREGNNEYNNAYNVRNIEREKDRKWRQFGHWSLCLWRRDYFKVMSWFTIW